MAVAFVQAFPTAASPGSGPVTGSATTFATSFASANTAGNCLTAVVTWDSTVQKSVSSVTDTAGNTYTQVNAQVDPRDQALAVWVALNCNAATTNTVTATWPGTCTSRAVSVAEYSGVAASSALDGNTGNIGNGTNATDNLTSGSITTTTAGDLLIGAFEQYNGGNISAGTGYTLRSIWLTGGISQLSLEDRVQTSAGSAAATLTISNGAGTGYMGIIAALKAAANVEVVTGSQSLALGLTGVVERVGIVTGALDLDLGLVGTVQTAETHTTTGTISFDASVADATEKVATTGGMANLALALTGTESPVGVGTGALHVGVPLAATESKVATATGTLSLNLRLQSGEAQTRNDLSLTVGPILGNWSPAAPGLGGWSTAGVGSPGWAAVPAGNDWTFGPPTA